jgi:hypothetical protein
VIKHAYLQAVQYALRATGHKRQLPSLNLLGDAGEKHGGCTCGPQGKSGGNSESSYSALLVLSPACRSGPLSNGGPFHGVLAGVLIGKRKLLEVLFLPTCSSTLPSKPAQGTQGAQSRFWQQTM